MAGGIYQIRNLITDKIYIGSTQDFYHRKAEHFSLLKNNKHHSKYLQYSATKYGISNFVFEKLAECPNDYLVKLEQWFIDTLKPQYNMHQIAGGSRGYTFKDNKERCFKISIKTRKLNGSQVEEVLRLHTEGVTLSELGNLYNIDPSNLSRIVGGRWYKHLNLPTKPINTNIKPNKLKDKQVVIAIFKELEAGISQKVLSKKYGVTQSTISRIKTKSRRFSWLNQELYATL